MSISHQPVKWSGGGIEDPPGVECLTCGHVTPTEDGRCPRCGKALTQLRRPTTGPGSPPANSAPVRLPATRAVRAWLDATLKVEQELEESVRQHVGRLAAAQKEMNAAQDDIRASQRAAAAFSSLLQQVQVAEQPEAAGSRRRGPGQPRLNGRWSRKHAACVRCGTTEIKHDSRGLCRTCYAKRTKEIPIDA